MDSFTHTLIATGLLAASYYIGAYFAYRKGVKVGYQVGVAQANRFHELLAILGDEAKAEEQSQYELFGDEEDDFEQR